MVALQEGRTKLRKGIKHISEEGKVVFSNGLEEEYDYIITTTGFEPSMYPFLSGSYRKNCTKDRYKGVFHPDLSKNMAFIGFMRGHVGSLVLGFELQARWFALVCSGKRSLPSTDKMKEEIEEVRKKNIGYNACSGTWFYANHLARHCVDCEPNFMRLLVQHPLVCFKAYCSNFNGYLFRLRGPHANVEKVLDGYALSNGVYNISFAWHVQHLVWALMSPLFDLYSNIPLIGWIFIPLLSTWY